MKDYSRILYGNTELISMMLRDISHGMLSHAYIIEGDEGSGKKSLATIIAASLACMEKDGACLVCENCKKIFMGLCPDVITVSCPKGRKTIGVETIRTLKKNVYVSPNELDCKVFIIEDSHLMTEEAQNALLKILEEPPKNVYFFLLCENINSILPTVKSRAAVLKMQKFGFEELSEYILNDSKKAQALYESSRSDFEFNVRASRGSIGQLKKRFSGVQDEAALKKYETIKKIVGLLCSSDKAELIMFCSKLSDNREQLSDLYESLSFAFRDLLYYKKSKGSDLMFYIDRKEASQYVMKYTQSDVIKLIGLCEKVRNELDTNVNITTAQLKFAADLWNVKHS